MVWVVIAAADEADRLRVLLPRVVSEVEAGDPEGRVLVVDDGSVDDTVALVVRLMVDREVLELEPLRHRSGRAAALRRGVRRALEDGADVVVTMDADGRVVPVGPRPLRPAAAGDTPGRRGHRSDCRWCLGASLA